MLKVQSKRIIRTWLVLCQMTPRIETNHFLRSGTAVADQDFGLGGSIFGAERYECSPCVKITPPFCINFFPYGHCCAPPMSRQRHEEWDIFFWNIPVHLWQAKGVVLFPRAILCNGSLVLITLFFAEPSLRNNNQSNSHWDREIHVHVD